MALPDTRPGSVEPPGGAVPAEQRTEQSTTAEATRWRDGDLFHRAGLEFLAWQSGDRAALDRLVRLVTPVLWHVARGYGLDQASAEDVVQSAWLALVRRRDTINEPQAVIRWLTVTTRREAWRTTRRQRRVDLADDQELDRIGDEEGPELAAVRNLQVATLWEAVARLTERCQRLLRIVAFSERADYVGLSGELGMPVGSIGPTRGRCLAKLRALLGSALEWSNS
jgi:RNA polymerase sigma factor (sigma-70 family)